MLNIVFFIAAPFIALLMQGVQRKIAARMQNRRGPPVLQPFYDVAKLLGKKSIKSKNDLFFKIAPLLYLIAIYAIFIVLPPSLASFDYDFIFLFYMVMLANAFYILGGISSDSPYSITGSMREMFLMVCFEITMAVAVFTFIIYSHTLSFSGIVPMAMLYLPLASICMIAVALAEVKITPFDTAEAETEILPGVDTEYAGKQLMFLDVAKSMKMLFYVMFLPVLFVGVQNAFLFIMAAIVIFLAITFAQAAMPRYGVEVTYRELSIILLLAVAEFVRVSWGIGW